MGNLDLYERYAQPPDNALKPFSNGKFKGTDINPMWRIKALTEEFGPCGIGWYTEIINQWREDTADGTATVYCHIHLFVKVGGEWSRPIVGIGGNTLHRKTQSGTTTTDEAYKMAYTDAMGIACKALGIGANVWWQDARTKYTANDESPERTEEKTPPPPLCEDCGMLVTDYITTNGVTKAADIANKSRNLYGRCLCGRCSVKAGKAS